MNWYLRFQELLLEHLRPVFDRAKRQHHDFEVSSLRRLLFDDDQTEPPPQPNHDGNTLFAARLFFGFTEIASSFDTLGDIETYIGRFPFGGTDITRTRYLRFQCEGYLHEFYILKERLCAYLNSLEREYRLDRSYTKLERVTNALDSYVVETLEPLTKTRNLHVHDRRLSDRRIERLATLELLISAGESPMMKHYYNSQYLEIRRDMKKEIVDLNTEVLKILDHYFEELASFLFPDDTRELRIPSRFSEKGSERQ